VYTCEYVYVRVGGCGWVGVQVVGLAPAALVVQRVAMKQDMPQPDPKDKMIKSLPKVVHHVMLRLNVWLPRTRNPKRMCVCVCARARVFVLCVCVCVFVVCLCVCVGVLSLNPVLYLNPTQVPIEKEQRATDDLQHALGARRVSYWRLVRELVRAGSFKVRYAHYVCTHVCEP